MIKVPYEEVVGKIISETDLTKEEVEKKVKEKMDQLSGLISKEGAAHIIANELNVKLFEIKESKLKIKDILPGLRNLEVIGKMLKSYGIREFKVQDRSGKVGSFLIADETGMLRVVMWGSLAEELNNMKEGDIIKINSGYSKDNNGYKEVHLNDKSTVEINPDDIDKLDYENVIQKRETNRKKISDLQENDSNIELFGTLVDLFDIRFFEVCSECNKRVKQDTDFKCANHPESKFTYSYVLNGFSDDGTDNVRLVLFRDRVNDLLQKSTEEVLKIRNDLENFSEIKTSVLGSQLKVQGRVVKNQMFDRIEFMVNSLDINPDPEEEIKDKEENKE